MRTPTENIERPFAIVEQRLGKRRLHLHKDLQNFFGLSQEEFDHLIGVAGGKATKDLQSIKESLEDLFSPGEINRWLHAPNSMFDGKTPVKAMVEGQTHRILQLLVQLEEGIPY